MPIKHKVLIFPAGSEIGLEIYNSLKYSHHIEVFGFSGKSDHATFIYDNEHYIQDELLHVNHPNFISRFNGYLQQLNIEFIYPTHDTVANYLAEHQDSLKAQLISSNKKTNRIARSKRETYKTFNSFGFCPKIYVAPYSGLTFPIFLKPDDGQGGKGTFYADNEPALKFYLSKSPDLLASEFLPGEELSVDCFTDFNGELLFIGARTRERVQMGISFRSTAVVADNEITFIAQSINTKLAMNGAWFFQIKKDIQGKYKLLEFAARQSSTMALYRHAGINFALLSFFNAQKIKVKILQNDYALQLDRCLYNRFRADFIYRRIYIDFDETIIEGDKVNDQVMAFLYQCRNQKIEIVLITKHRYDLDGTLEKFCISKNLFSNIILLSNDQNKWQFIDPDGSIFIDNYWFDRQDVKQKLGIPVFDVDAVECLLR